MQEYRVGIQLSIFKIGQALDDKEFGTIVILGGIEFEQLFQAEILQ